MPWMMGAKLPETEQVSGRGEGETRWAAGAAAVYPRPLACGDGHT